MLSSVLKSVVSVVAVVTAAQGYSQSVLYETPSVPQGEVCQPLVDSDAGFAGFATCTVDDWAVEDLSNGMRFSHKVVGEVMVAEMTAPTTGWVGFGIGSMANSDMVIGWYDSTTEQSVVGDYFTAGRRFPLLDSDNGGSSSLLFAQATEADGSTTVRFVRKLEADENTDKSITPGSQQRLIFAFGNSDDFQRHPRGATAAYNFTIVPEI